MDHPEWDLIAYSGVNSDFWDVETPDDRATGETRPTSEEAGETDIVEIDPSA